MSCLKKEFNKKNINSSCVFNKARDIFSAATQALGYSLLLSHLTFIPYVYAGPTGGHIVGGVGHIHSADLTTDIHQISNSLAIDWASYNLNRNEVVNYLQPGVNSIALNRILDISASQIRGQINSNGQVILVNPNGIFFGSDAAVNVGGLIASGLDISPTDFMNGKLVVAGCVLVGA